MLCYSNGTNKNRGLVQFRSFWLPKCRPYVYIHVGLNEKVPRRRAVHRHSRQPSIQVTGIWWERHLGCAMVKAAKADAPVPAATPSTPPPTTSSTPTIRGAGDLHQLCHHQYQCATATHVSDRRTSVNMNSLYMAYWSTVDNLLAHVRWRVTASGGHGFNN